MRIVLNGKESETAAETVSGLLAEVGMAELPVVVEHNESALLKQELATTALRENDRIEVITLAAGG